MNQSKAIERPNFVMVRWSKKLGKNSSTPYPYFLRREWFQRVRNNENFGLDL